jgi:hypothetical protein
VVFVIFISIWVFWFRQANNFSDSAVSGTYVLQGNRDTSTLVLRTDHIFVQELNSAGSSKHAEGTWKTSSEGHIEFSKEFLKLSGQQLNPAGQAYGQIDNQFGLLSLTLAPNPDGPRFHKRLFH